MHSGKSANLRKGRVSERSRIYLITACTDQRRPLFANATFAQLLVDALVAGATLSSASTLAYVVMPDHLHWLLEIREPRSLPAIVRRLKGRTARRINMLRRTSGRVWQPGFHDHALRRFEAVEKVSNYIIHNPVRAGLVERADDYAYWDTVWHRRRQDLRPRDRG